MALGSVIPISSLYYLVTGCVLDIFPKICQMMVESQFVDPGPVFAHLYHQALRKEAAEAVNRTSIYCDVENDDETLSISSVSQYSTLSDLEAMIYPGQPWKDLLLTSRTEVYLNPWRQSSNLISLKFHNITLNTRGLLFWLCNQTHIPHTPVMIELTGTAVVYGFDEALFEKILQSINVKLSHDPFKTYFYGTELFEVDQSPQDRTLIVKHLINPKRASYCNWSDGNLDDIEETISPPFSITDELQFSARHHLKCSHLPVAHFSHRPGVFERLFHTDLKDNQGRCRIYTYYAYMSSQVSFAWEATPFYPTDLPPHKHALAMVRAISDYDLHPTEVEERGLANVRLEEQEQAGVWQNSPNTDEDARHRHDQELLLVYETEYLRLDARKDDII